MINLKIKDKDYQLRLTTKGCVSCEKRLGKNPINVFMEAAETNALPMFSDLVIIFHECLVPYNHNISFDNACDLIDSYCEDGYSLTDLLQVLIDVFQDSGMIPKVDDSKNA